MTPEMTPVQILAQLGAAHRSPAEALSDPVVRQKGTPACVQECLKLIRDTPVTEFVADFRRGLRGEEQLTAAVAKKLQRFETALGPSGLKLEHIQRFIRRLAETWAVVPNLQSVMNAVCAANVILTIEYPWFGNPEYVGVSYNGMSHLRFRVLDKDEGGPCKVQIVNQSDPKLNVFISHDPRVPSYFKRAWESRVRLDRPHASKRFSDIVASQGHDGILSIGQFNELLQKFVAVMATMESGKRV